jgi:hypothetical protein
MIGRGSVFPTKDPLTKLEILGYTKIKTKYKYVDFRVERVLFIKKLKYRYSITIEKEYKGQLIPFNYTGELRDTGEEALQDGHDKIEKEL